MASMWQKTLFYLGLVDEDKIAEAEENPPAADSGVRTVDNQADLGRVPERASARPSGHVAGRRVEPPSRDKVRMSSNRQHAEAGVRVRSAAEFEAETNAMGGESEVVTARTFTDAQVLADRIRAGRPVVLDLRSTEPEMVRRLVDFASGLTYALDGRMGKIAQGVILVTPQGVTLGAGEQQRLTDLGLYSAASSD